VWRSGGSSPTHRPLEPSTDFPRFSLSLACSRRRPSRDGLAPSFEVDEYRELVLEDLRGEGHGVLGLDRAVRPDSRLRRGGVVVCLYRRALSSTLKLTVLIGETSESMANDADRHRRGLLRSAWDVAAAPCHLQLDARFAPSNT